MNRMNKLERIKRDNLLVNILSSHTGENNACKHTEILNVLKQSGFPITHDGLRHLITKVKLERHLPILYKRGKGYFWASNKEEILETIKDLISMQSALQEQINLLQKFVF